MSARAPSELNESDERLIAQVRIGDERAFATIVERYGPPLVGYSRRIVGDDAQDVVQQALISAWSALRGGCEVRDLRPWLFTIAHRAALQNLRSRGEFAVELPASLVGDASPAESFERSDRAHAVLAAIASLPADEQRALVATSVHGRSGRDTATALGLTEGAVRQLVFRARTRVKAAAHVFVPPTPGLAALARWSHVARRLTGLSGSPSPATSSPAPAGMFVKLGALLATGLVVGAPVVALKRGDHHHKPSSQAAIERPAGGSAHLALPLSRKPAHAHTPTRSAHTGARASTAPPKTTPGTSRQPISESPGSVSGSTADGRGSNTAGGETSATGRQAGDGSAGAPGPAETPAPAAGHVLAEAPKGNVNAPPVVHQVPPTVAQTVHGLGEAAHEVHGELENTGEAVNQGVHEVLPPPAGTPSSLHLP